MIKQSVHNILAIGVDVVRLAVSAKKAGYEVFAVDYFGDQDLERVCLKDLSIVEQRPWATCGRMGTDFEAEALLHLAKELAEKNQIDGVLLSSGLDDSHRVLCELNDLIPILGNQPDVIKRVRDKTDFFRELRRLGIHHPETVIVEGFEEAKKEGKDIGYPVLIKPSRGFAGVGIRKARDLNELKHAFKDVSVIDEKVVVQDYISGTHASMSLISSTKETMILTLNAQLQGIAGVGQREPFGYCGNVVPLVTTRTVVEKCRTISDRITSNFGLVGSNGIDFIVSNEGEPYVVEVNPRFQATLECVERVLRMNVVEAHLNACLQGKLPGVAKKAVVFCARLILFAPERSIVPDLNTFEEARDIPLPGVVIEKGEPVCSIVVEEANHESSLRTAMLTAEQIRKSLQPTD